MIPRRQRAVPAAVELGLLSSSSSAAVSLPHPQSPPHPLATPSSGRPPPSCDARPPCAPGRVSLSAPATRCVPHAAVCVGASLRGARRRPATHADPRRRAGLALPYTARCVHPPPSDDACRPAHRAGRAPVPRTARCVHPAAVHVGASPRGARRRPATHADPRTGQGEPCPYTACCTPTLPSVCRAPAAVRRRTPTRAPGEAREYLRSDALQSGFSRTSWHARPCASSQREWGNAGAAPAKSAEQT